MISHILTYSFAVLTEFTAIKRFFSTFLGIKKDVFVDPDPTFLVNVENYRELKKKPKFYNGEDFIFLYLLDNQYNFNFDYLTNFFIANRSLSIIFSFLYFCENTQLQGLPQVHSSQSPACRLPEDRQFLLQTQKFWRGQFHLNNFPVLE